MSKTHEDLEAALAADGPAAAIDHLCQTLRERKDYHGLFYGMLLRRRHELGLPAVQVGTADNIPKDLQEPYEDAIREAARTVGQYYLDEADIPSAWPFYRMIGEPAKVAEALEKADPDDGERCQQLVDIAFHQGAHPRRGFELALKRYGLCSAITMFGQEVPMPAEAREQCLKRLVHALYDELLGRLAAEIEPKEGTRPTATSVRAMIAGRDWLFEDEFYHIDTSHLSAVVQFSIHLPPSAELNLAMELCEYGMRLSPRLQFQADPPFEDQYRDYHVYFRTLGGQDADAGIAHFRAKAEKANPEEDGTLPAEVLVILLVRLGRHPEAVDAFVRHLAAVDARRLNCPSLQELCQVTGDYRPLVEVSRQRDDLVNFTAGLLQSHAAAARP